MTRWGVVFDLDDTLYLEREYVRSGFRAVARRAHREFGLSGLYDELERAFNEGNRTTVIDAACQAVDARVEVSTVQALVQTYRGHQPQIVLLEEARTALQWAVGQGPSGLLSDGDPVRQELKLRALGLDRWLDPVVLTGARGIGWGKPDVRAFRLVADAWVGVDALVYVADNPMKDFTGPASLGWKTVRVRHPRGLHAEAVSGPEVDHEVLDVGEIPYLLGSQLFRRHA